MITFSNVSKSFGRFTAVHGVTFGVAARQAVALWGANGAGKTTLIKCLLGLLHYNGEIRVDGFEAQRQGRDVRRLVGYVPQELAFYEEMNTLDTARFYAQLKQVPTSEALKVLCQVGLEEHVAKPVSALSGGMKQRLALGLALLGDPPVLVLDEPTSNLDVVGRNQFLQLLTQVMAAGKTILFTSHRLEEIEMLADQVIVLERGGILLSCPGAELAARIGLRATIKLRLPAELLEKALHILQNDGFSARRNGVGVLVDVPPGEKARPIHTLSRAQIAVTDFEME